MPTELIIILVLSGIAALLVLFARANRWEEKEKTRRERTRQRYEQLEVRLAWALTQHGDALFQRLRQTSYKDPYGNWVLNEVAKELRYFFDNVVVPEICPENEQEFIFLRERLTDWCAGMDPAEWHEIREDPDPADSRRDGRGYERFVASRLVQAGFSVTYTPASGDQGVDLLAERDGRRVAIQCKDYAKPAGNDAVQQIYAGARFYGAARAVVVAPNGYTTAARQLAGSLGVDCLHEDELVGALS